MKLLGFFKIVVSLQTKILGYGVMATHQILVLTFQVRILVAQHNYYEILLNLVFLFRGCLIPHNKT